jgi:hypothetical protein
MDAGSLVLRQCSIYGLGATGCASAVLVFCCSESTGKASGTPILLCIDEALG